MPTDATFEAMSLPPASPDSDGASDVLAFPASPAQEAFFYLEKLSPTHTAFNVPVRFRLDGALDAALLTRAVTALTERHETLRTRFAEEDGRLLQVVEPAAAIAIPLTDLTHLEGAALEAEIDRLGSLEARARFDLSQSPLFRASLLATGPDRHILQVTVHHSVSDGWSIGLITDELAEFYNAFLEDRAPQLEPLAVQYADFSIWQREFLDSPEIGHLLAFWKEQLSGYVELELPTDRPRPVEKSWDGDIVSRILPAVISDQVARLAREQGATLFHVFLAAFKAVAARYTGLADIAVGTPVAGRTRAELEPVIGTFINSVILRTDLSGDPSFRELVNRVRNSATDAIAHQELPFEQLVKALQPRRDPGRNPLFQINFTHQRDFVRPVSFGGAKLTAFPSRSPGAIFDLHFFMVERADGWRASCDFARDLFDRETALRLLGHFETLLETAVASPDRPLSSLPILRQEEREQLAGWSGQRPACPAGQSLGELFLASARRHADRPAIRHAGAEISYRALAHAALALSHQLSAAGVKPGDCVALCAPSVPEMIAAQLGIVLAGATCVPLDPDYPPERLHFMLQDCGAAVLLAAVDFATKFGDIRTLPLTAIEADSDRQEIGEAPVSGIGGEAVSHIFYTSGSTGTPKGVRVAHRGIARLVHGAGFMDFGPDDAFLQAAPISFDAATLEIWMPLLHGGRIVTSGAAGPSLETLAKAVREDGVTCLWLTAGLFQTMVDEHLADLRGLKYLLAGGDVLSPAHVRRALEGLPGTTLVNGYGPTENTTFTCCHTITAADLSLPSIPIGRPIGNTTVHILDARGEPLPVGVPGELYTGGEGLALGYLNRPDLTAEKFVQGADGLPLYRTGDLCRWRPDGSIEFIGRADQQVKVRGFRIETPEIETALMSHPAVRQARVGVRGTDAGSKKLLAWVIPAAEVTPAQLKDHLRQRLPGYMLPAGIGLLESFPLNANGKIDIAALADPTAATTAARPAADTETEKRLVALWQELLERTDVGPEDDWFELGGHSLLALRLFSRIHRDFARTLPLAALINHPTVRALALLLAPEAETEAPPIASPSLATPSRGHRVTLREGSAAPPLFCIHGGDGGVLFYRKLAALLPEGQALHAIESRDLGSSEVIREATVEETATAYLQHLLAVQPQGPFRLAGYSFGGVVAHEIACQLVAAGHAVDFVGLFDTHSPTDSVHHYSLPGRLRTFWQQQEGVPLLPRLGRLRHRIAEGVATHRRVRAEVAAAQSSGPAAPHSDLRRVQVREENWRAMQAYEPRLFTGRLTLFKATTVSDKVAHSDDYGWGRVAGGGLDVIPVPGQHLTLFEDENVGDLARALASALGALPSRIVA